ncbi:hypothetical protein G6O67_006515 [Ophiocordyceps sinensis]|uniref:Glutaminase GtaA n=2 Tax=Ophiocordyceps sinensis TaxID=72228 RepID=A0A8H4PMU6_9HYPO|nr:glutaminase GtaA [Ophiocordyceps sinensis CO18]KAF4506426.1 hypothetical protein G6O67_006515 [Ophiocordyceps sinensis]
MKLIRLAAVAVLAVLGREAAAESKFTPARPPAAPLAVRSPFLNVWLNGRTDGKPSGYLPGQWPRFWTQAIQGWQGLVRVDGKAFNWMGDAPNSPPLVEQVSLEYTSTKTTFIMNVDGKVQLSIKFLSPVYYDDMRRQSVTSSYLEVSAKSLDGRRHKVQVYCDVSGEWASGDNGATIQWESNSKDGVRYHKFFRKDQQVFKDINEIASWGNWYWATGEQPGLSYQIGADTDVRQRFVNDGRLSGDIDKNFRPINDRWPVFAHCRDLGDVGGDDWVHTLFTIGYTQDDAINFQGKEATPRAVPSLWKQWFSENQLVSFFYKDYGFAVRHSQRLDARVARDSRAAAGDDYLTITSLSVRQVFGALGITGTREKTLVFLKEISSNSDIQTVDVIFPAFPIFLYLNPELIRYMLDPLLENSRAHYPNNYAQHDLGRYPVALGHPKGDDEPMPLEECGNMVIMMLAYAQSKQDIRYLADNWDLLEKWAQYLIHDAKIPANQLSTDDFAGHLANQTNLAIKGIIALAAMSKIAGLTGHGDQRLNYSLTATEYLEFWIEHSINTKANPRHTMLQYDSPETHGLLYNLYPDKLLGINLIPQPIYDMQSDFYLSAQKQFGVVLDTRGTLTKLDWQLFAAAVAKPETRDMFIRKIADWINRTTTWRAFTDLYDAENGGYPRGLEFTARPVQGAVFSLLALNGRGR